jgi:hypothetical protein
MQYAFNVDTDLSCMWQGAPIETLSKVHCILFTDRLVFTTCRIFSLNLHFVVSTVYLTMRPITQPTGPYIHRG